MMIEYNQSEPDTIRCEIKRIVNDNPVSYRSVLKKRYPIIWGELTKSSMSFAEAAYLYFTDTTKKDHTCLHCRQYTKFWTATRGYFTYCSVKCRNIHWSMKIQEIKDITLPLTDDVLSAISDKHSAIPFVLRTTFPSLYDHLTTTFENGTISEKLYRWAFPAKYVCASCKAPTKFLDFRRGFQLYCGNKCMANSDEIKQKRERTLLAKTGFRSPMQSSESKSLQKKRAFSSKLYKLPSGREITVQGYEGKVLSDLFKAGFLEEDIILDEASIPTIIWKDESGKIHRYYPDMFIPKMNLLIEVKSMHTWRGYESNRKSSFDGKAINLIKRQACLDAGYNFKFMIR